MVNIDELYIPVKGHNIILKASVKTESYYTDVYIDSVKIYNKDTYKDKKAIYTYPQLGSLTNKKNIELSINSSVLAESVKDNLFIIEITTNGNPTSDTPCGMDNDTVTTAVFDVCKIYDKILNSLKELDSPCSAVDSNLNSLLQYNALKIAIETGNISTAIELYNKFFATDTITNPPCKCNG